MPRNSNVSLEERKEQILNLLQTEGKVRCSALSELFSVSEVSIRSTLSAMEKDGLLERTHGGAVLPSSSRTTPQTFGRRGRHADEKRRIAKRIASMIHSGETLFVNSGTTTLFVVEELKRLPRSEHCHQLHSDLQWNSTITPISTSFSWAGNMDQTRSFTYGDDALAQLRKYRADKLILSIDGISRRRG